MSVCACVHYHVHVEVRGLCLLLSSCESQGLNSGHRAWWQAPLSTAISLRPTHDFSTFIQKDVKLDHSRKPSMDAHASWEILSPGDTCWKCHLLVPQFHGCRYDTDISSSWPYSIPVWLPLQFSQEAQHGGSPFPWGRLKDTPLPSALGRLVQLF